MLKQKNLILIGAPGAGKGTFSAWLRSQQPLVHISTGELLREEIARGTELGKAAAELMNAGRLVSDELVAAMVKQQLSSEACDHGFILDGFPRTVHQAELLAGVLRETGRELDRVILLEVPDELLLQRLTARLCCRDCGAVYNRLFMPPKSPGVCDRCGGELFQRADDSPGTARNRLKVFYEQTRPVIDYYAGSGKLLVIKEQEKDRVEAKLAEELT